MCSYSEVIEDNSLLNFFRCAMNRCGITYRIAVLFYSIFSISLVIIGLLLLNMHLIICAYCSAGV